MNDFVVLKDIEFTFTNSGQKKYQFQNFDLNIHKYQKIAIMGINGSGKTTLLKILNGLIFPQNGTYHFQSQPISQQTLKEKELHKNFRKNCVLLFQNAELMLFHSTVYDDLAFGLRQLSQTEDQIKDKVQYWSKVFQIENLLHENPLYLSGGQKKRIALACLFILEPELVLLDEPFNALDPIYTDFLIYFLKEVHTTILFTSHNFTLSESITEDILILHPEYQKIFLGTTNEFYSKKELVKKSELLLEE